MAESLCCQAVLKKLRQQLAEEERKLRCDGDASPHCLQCAMAFHLAERSLIWYFDMSTLHFRIIMFFTLGCLRALQGVK